MPNETDYAAFADAVFAPLFPWLFTDLERHVGARLRGSVVDLGCGPGHLAVEVVRGRPESLLLVDRDRTAVLNALERVGRANAGASDRPGGERLHGCVGDADHLPLRAGCCDVVYSRGSVMFWAEPATAFAGIHRVLRPGGVAMIGGGFGISTPPEVIADVDARRARWQAEHGESGHVPRVDVDMLAATMGRIGSPPEVIAARRGFWLVWRR